ncbi:hypothetical protein H2201_008768 [Coniosporium apollinis]|uniref:BTB domain-containing protein n=1 Tax=Coniosporium apollinis TaxID=61459 RepID=A0ABQ9NLY5_9PEZI|nr:hypothetical protein H2201_008768 [Coniosporium apollinis]
MTATIPFKDLILSDQFTFYIGKEKKPVVVHSAVIAAQSPALNALINNGHMQEAQTRSAEIDDIEPDDFIRFCEFAYRGDFTVPPCEVVDVPPSEEATDQVIVYEPDGVSEHSGAEIPQPDDYLVPPPPPPAQEEPAAESDSWVPPIKKKGKKPRYTSPRRPTIKELFNSKSFGSTGVLREQFLPFYAPGFNNGPNENFTPVFLAYSRLYVLAQKYLIEPLKELTLSKLHRTLLGFSLYTSRIGDVLELVRYVYCDDHTPATDEDNKMNKLRELVAEYIACEIDTIGKSKVFLDLLEEGGDFVREFWVIVQKYRLVRS